MQSMNQTEILNQLRYQCASNGFLQVSRPLAFQEQGPFIFALAALDNEAYFFGFEVISSSAFLANSSARSSVYGDSAFFDMLNQHFDLSSFDKIQPPHTTLHKIVPDEPACRLELQRLWQTNAAAAACVMLLSPCGDWYTGKDILDTPVWVI
jgi:hypothetical protein